MSLAFLLQPLIHLLGWETYPTWISTTFLSLLLVFSLSQIPSALSPSTSSPSSNTPIPEDEEKLKIASRLRWQYLIVYLVVMFADWLQGTHMYSLYQVSKYICE